MRKRHILAVGFGLGALVAAAVFGLTVTSLPQLHSTPAGTNVQAGLSPSPNPARSPLAAGASAAPTAQSPAARSGAMMVYDPEDSGVIMFGGGTVQPQPDGSNLAVPLGDTWLWNGKWWTQLDAVGPSPRSLASVAYDSARHVVVLFGGSGPGGVGNAQLFQDTWTWDGKSWTLQSPAHNPEPRSDAAMAFDKDGGEIVMYGGQSQTSAYISTWTWNGADWALRDTPVYPSARYFTSMAYDDATDRAVLFGGNGLYGQRLNDTWTWDGATWTRLTTPAPAASGWSSLVFDGAAKVVVAYVYYALDNHPVREYTMTWDGTAWRDRSTASDPSPRAGVAMAYNAGVDHVVMFGGSYIDPVPYAETWIWSGGAWSKATAQA